MQAVSTSYPQEVREIESNKQSNRHGLDRASDPDLGLDPGRELDLDWLGQQSIGDLKDRAPELLVQLAQARSELGEDDPFGTAQFAADTPVVVLLRALFRVVELAAARG